MSRLQNVQVHGFVFCNGEPTANIPVTLLEYDSESPLTLHHHATMCRLRAERCARTRVHERSRRVQHRGNGERGEHRPLFLNLNLYFQLFGIDPFIVFEHSCNAIGVSFTGFRNRTMVRKRKNDTGLSQGRQVHRSAKLHQ